MPSRHLRHTGEPVLQRPQSSPPVAELFKAVGGRIRAARLDQRLTLDELSARSNVSRRMITMLEAGETNASIGTLDKIARALGLDFAALVAVRPVPTLTPETSRSVPPAWEDGRGSAAHLLYSCSGTRTVELWQWELVGGARYEADADPPGSEELVVVHSGRLVVEVAQEPYALEAGEHLRMPTDAPYAFVNPARKTVKFDLVILIF